MRRSGLLRYQHAAQHFSNECVAAVRISLRVVRMDTRLWRGTFVEQTVFQAIADQFGDTAHLHFL